jgi:mRNA-degrading endonuclease toxin of MazEF toxin-antitoxin module
MIKSNGYVFRPSGLYKKGDILLVNFNLVPGSLFNKIRNAVVLRGNSPPETPSDRIIILPCSTSSLYKHDCDVIIPNNTGDVRIVVCEAVIINTCYIMKYVSTLPKSKIKELTTAWYKFKGLT